MSKVALRVYNREIEALVDQGHIDEAVAHCQHVLKTYPKHLETYRLLGKAYLEARRYPDAADIFQRVLTSVPDDFVSHLGMSIVYDEQKNLDQAIWHMERAYESNPSNGGVQAELRRLYGRRDGLEPPKIQLTRGALAKMYIRGAQYGQAIQEIKTVLQEDKERLDLKVLLAQAYFRFDKKVEATEMCNEILKVSPYCFDANRVMVEILPGTGLASNLETYKKRLQQLDPYTALVTGSTFEVASVQDAAVTIERLEWDPSAAAQIAPDWQSDSEPAAEEDVDSGEDIPGWMKTSGWGPSSGEFQEGPVDFDESAGAPADELAAAEIPDWLKAMAPPGSSGPQSSGADEPEAQDADLDWLSGISTASGIALAATDAESEQPATAQSESPAAEDDNSDWLAGLGAESEQPAAMQAEPESPAAEDDNSDWLAGLGAESEQPAAPQAEAPSDVPDWLAGLGAESEQPAAMQIEPESPAAEDDNSDWLAGLSAETEQPAAPQAEAPSDVPDWLAGLGAETEQPAATQAEPESPAAEDDNSDWLAGLGAESEQPAAPQAEAPSDVPDWLAGLGAESEQPAALQVEPESPATEDDNSDWLAGLGAETEQPGALQAEAPSDVPDWLAGMGAETEQPAAMQAEPESPATENDNSDWLAGLGAESEQPAAPQAEPASDVPDWLSGLGAESEQPADAQFEPEPTAGDGTSDWLTELGESEEPAIPQAESVSDVPDWLAGLGTDAGQPAAMEDTEQPVMSDKSQLQPDSQAEPASEWLAGLSESEGEQAEGEPLSALISGPGTSETEQDEAFKWLESLAAGQGAKPEELLTQPEERLEQAPGWVEDVDSAPATPADVEHPQSVSQPSSEIEDEPLGELSALVTAPGTSELEQDDAFKWLESLAAGQGAKPEELLTKPEERLEQAPGWVDDFESISATPAAVEPAQFVPEPPIEVEDEPAMGELSALVTAPGTSELEQDDAFKWLESLAAGQGAKPEELLTKPEERLEQAPGWVDDVENPPPALSELISGPGTSQDDQDESFKWLENLAAGQGARPEELLTRPEERLDHSPEWVAESALEPQASSSSESLYEPVAEEPLVDQPDQLEVPLTDESEGEVPQHYAQAEVESVQPEPQMEDEDQPLAELSAPVMAPGMSENDQDEAFKWLENLAAGQGAKPEELLTKPEERLEQSPEWVAEFESQPEEPVAQIAAEAVVPEPSITDPTLDWFAPGEPEQPQAADETDVVTDSDLDQMGVTQWLETLDDEETPSQPQVAGSGQAVSEDLPDWLKDEAGDELPPAPVPVSGWVPEEELLPSFKLEADSPEAADELPETGSQAPAESAPQPIPVAAEAESAPPVAREEAPAPPPPLREAVRQTGMLGGDKDAMLLQRSRLLLDKANLDTAMSEYSRLIKKGKYIDEIVFDLQEATYSHPVDVIVWQTLGDAYMRNNRLQEALDAYTKAEELLR
ncbi:MAG: tetratricopeptide repeat protein [Anaerolineae bacterium]|nr:tetratricopeptide repeat protein [Anaerolineae bacterium]